MADIAGEQAFNEGIGEAIGAVVIDPNEMDSSQAIAIAGDARWQLTMGATPREGNGNVMAHAVMRVIGMVAGKRVSSSSTSREPNPQDSTSPAPLAGLPITRIEHDIYSSNAIIPGGYLCVGLDIYITHEPCVMCSMALLHSRFSRVVFGKRMPRSGGLTAEMGHETGKGGLGYGLWWMDELNWKVLAWEWVDEDEGEVLEKREVGDDVHA